jgi:adenylate cyclase class 2
VRQDDDLEVEVKFLVEDLEAVRHRLAALGATISKPRLFERNVRYDNIWDGLGRKGHLLRLRQDDDARLTFKGLPPAPVASEARVREELEVTVSDFATMERLLERIGFTPRQVYEKYRETWQAGDVEAVLDELPFGDFVELEGPEEALQPLAQRLGLSWERRLLANYLALLEQLKGHHDLPFADLTFANFTDRPVSIHDVIAPADTPH